MHKNARQMDELIDPQELITVLKELFDAARDGLYFADPGVRKSNLLFFAVRHLLTHQVQDMAQKAFAEAKALEARLLTSGTNGVLQLTALVEKMPAVIFVPVDPQKPERPFFELDWLKDKKRLVISDSIALNYKLNPLLNDAPCPALSASDCQGAFRQGAGCSKAADAESAPVPCYPLSAAAAQLERILKALGLYEFARKFNQPNLSAAALSGKFLTDGAARRLQQCADEFGFFPDPPELSLMALSLRIDTLQLLLQTAAEHERTGDKVQSRKFRGFVKEHLQELEQQLIEFCYLGCSKECRALRQKDFDTVLNASVTNRNYCHPDPQVPYSAILFTLRDLFSSISTCTQAAALQPPRPAQPEYARQLLSCLDNSPFWALPRGLGIKTLCDLFSLKSTCELLQIDLYDYINFVITTANQRVQEFRKNKKGGRQ
ncbi:MAG: hypothetical protein IAB19_09365 [Proteobacteria bacterium]|uniref:Uncharacterized protein n=1 Tax=Candidatus Avisuccinivibrio stercorigallinarum TaxID=2840704 RepID=A0A9D9DBB0_9GAMM|nr:hypothetical protein [Candidatus Avisuccinivibrio stercorigallinarum]